MKRDCNDCSEGGPRIRRRNVVRAACAIGTAIGLAIGACILTGHLSSPNYRVRLWISRADGSDTFVLPSWPWERSWSGDEVRKGIREVGDAAMPILIEIAEHDDNAIDRGSAAHFLDMYHDERSVQSLVDILKKDKDSGVRYVAALSLGVIGGPRELPALRLALSDRHSNVRDAALASIHEIERKEALTTRGK